MLPYTFLVAWNDQGKPRRISLRVPDPRVDIWAQILTEISRSQTGVSLHLTAIFSGCLSSRLQSRYSGRNPWCLRQICPHLGVWTQILINKLKFAHSPNGVQKVWNEGRRLYTNPKWTHWLMTSVTITCKIIVERKNVD